MPAQTYKLQSFSGPWTDETRSHPTLNFLEKYTNNIRNLGFSDSFSRWYAPSCVYYNGNGIIVSGGSAIWDWVGDEIFGSFSSIDVVDKLTRVRLIHNAAPAYWEDETLRKVAPQDADVVTYEHIIVFELKDERLRGEPIRVRRMMEWIIGREEAEGTGEGGLQVWQGKVCWDTSVVKAEVKKRLDAAAAASSSST